MMHRTSACACTPYCQIPVCRRPTIPPLLNCRQFPGAQLTSSCLLSNSATVSAFSSASTALLVVMLSSWFTCLRTSTAACAQGSHGQNWRQGDEAPSVGVSRHGLQSSWIT
eukprot:GHRQ01022721.1.p2 GENE.GHRQ01022721.1~~GHRQ01022721.1.p2  ORF type:complete len:111 (+),score=12.25 GHRQ01022721.1:308-640(+)